VLGGKRGLIGENKKKTKQVYPGEVGGRSCNTYIIEHRGRTGEAAGCWNRSCINDKEKKAGGGGSGTFMPFICEV